MKRIFIAVILMLVLTSCQVNVREEIYSSNEIEGLKSNGNIDSIENTVASKWRKFASEDGFFRVTININKLEFAEKEKIELFATLEYIGDEEEISTWSGNPNFKFVIFDGFDYYCEAMQEDILMMTTFKKGEIVTIPFQKAGGWDPQGPRGDYWEEYYNDPDLRLPKGTYEIKAYCDFSMNESVQFEEYKQEVKFEVVVK